MLFLETESLNASFANNVTLQVNCLKKCEQKLESSLIKSLSEKIKFGSV